MRILFLRPCTLATRAQHFLDKLEKVTLSASAFEVHTKRWVMFWLKRTAFLHLYVRFSSEVEAVPGTST